MGRPAGSVYLAWWMRGFIFHVIVLKRYVYLFIFIFFKFLTLLENKWCMYRQSACEVRYGYERGDVEAIGSGRQMMHLVHYFCLCLSPHLPSRSPIPVQKLMRRIMGWWLDHNWFGSLIFPWSLTVVSFIGCNVLSSKSYTCSRVILPTSRFMVLLPLLQIHIASLIFLVNWLSLYPVSLPPPSQWHTHRSILELWITASNAQKLDVIRTIMDRKNKIVTEEDDKKEEKKRLKSALKHCGYPRWTMDKVNQQMANKHTRSRTQRKRHRMIGQKVWWSSRT